MAKIGDLVPKSGIYTEPGVIVEKKDDGTIMVDTEPMTINKFHRYMNTTGLSIEEKTQFNEILDKIYQKESDLDKLNDIQTEIDDLKKDPLNKNIVQYLRNQQAVLIRQTKQLPKTYLSDEQTIKV
jgi:hypothetical protein